LSYILLVNSLSTYNRTTPYLAQIKERYLLTKPTSTKQTYHISLDLSNSELLFTAGDSVAILPQNNSTLVLRILKEINYSGEEPVFDPKAKTSHSLYSFLLNKANLSKAHTRFLSFLQERGAPLSPLLESKEKLHAALQSQNVLDFLRAHPVSIHSPQEFVDSLLPLMPRFYSIASSSKIFPTEIHLTVSFLSYIQQGEKRHGVASYFLCEQALIESTPIPLYIQPSNGFHLPSPDDSIILIGPGTGIAPFRAFLQERLAQQAKGRNWLFFGERHQATDFYYEPFFKELAHKNFLRLDTAFSRDQAEKIYVQHKLEENGASLWDWIQNGALLYVCGNAEKMAKDVDAALEQIISTHGSLSREEARLYLKRLRKEKRYLLDVY
jgi:sulfite reductase (NADPH) flavoprotein alpha-component